MMRAFIASVLLFLAGCSTRPQEARPADPEPPWEWLIVSWNDRTIMLDTLKDSLTFFEREYDSSDPTKGRRRSIFMAQGTRDSIWTIARRLMLAPELRGIQLTDHAGDHIQVKLCGESAGTVQSLEYRSQDGWPKEGDSGS